MSRENINRLVWNNGFTNDKRFKQNRNLNKADYKYCFKCGSSILFKKVSVKWFAMEPDFETFHLEKCDQYLKNNKIKVKNKCKYMNYKKINANK